MKFQILTDSSSDLHDGYLDGTEIGFKTIPLTIGVGETEFADEEGLDPAALLREMHESKEKSRSACPAPEAFLREFDRAEYTFVVTITAKLSGCCNAARVARDSYAHSERVHVIDSKGTSGSEILIVDRLRELIESGAEFEEITEKIEAYRDGVNLLFILQRFDNLIANGRMSKVAGLIASALVIRPICKADDGEIKIAKKLVGAKSAFSKLTSMVGELAPDQTGREIIVAECDASDEAADLKRRLEERYSFKNVRVVKMRGLNSYYALEKGVIVCF